MFYFLETQTTYTEEIKKSRFVVHAIPVDSENSAKQQINLISDLTATHNCWAWKIGQSYRFNDDGEPSGTAGKPILSAIEGQQCDHTLVIITRYFGGIKLGARGLIRAYGGSASRCLQQASLKPLIHRKAYQTSCDYSDWTILENELTKYNVLIDEPKFTGFGVELKLNLIESDVETINQFLINLTKGKKRLIKL